MTDKPVGTANLSDLVAEEIRAMMARRRISGRQLAQKLGVSPSWVSYRLTGAQPIDLNDLQQIAQALDVIVLRLLPREALQPQGSSAEATTRYPAVAEQPIQTPPVRTAPTRTPQPKRRPKAATSPGRGTPKDTTRRPAIIRDLVRA